MAKRFRVFYSLPEGVGSGRYSIDVLMTDDEDWQDAIQQAKQKAPILLFPDAVLPATANEWYSQAEFESAYQFQGIYLGLSFSAIARLGIEIVIPPPADMVVSDIQQLQFMDQTVRLVIAYDSKRNKRWNSRDRVRGGQSPYGLIGLGRS